MSRAERRRLEKQGKTARKELVLPMRASNLEWIKSEAREQAVDTAKVLLDKILFYLDYLSLMEMCIFIFYLYGGIFTVIEKEGGRRSVFYISADYDWLYGDCNVVEELNWLPSYMSGYEDDARLETVLEI